MIDVHRVPDDERWNRYVDRSPGGSVFHRAAFLRAIAAESGTELERLVGKNGEHPIGVFPVFTDSRGPIRLAFSPPPHTGIPHLGPAMCLDPNIKARKATTRTHEFLEACEEWLDEEYDPHYVRIVTNPALAEVRPFRWLGFDLSPRFAYELEIDREDEALLRSFSRDARSSIQDHYDPALAATDGGQLLADDSGERSVTETDAPAYSIERGGADAVETIASQLERRFDEQGETFPLSRSFLRTVYETLPDGTVEVYELHVDGSPVSGRLSLCHDGRLTFWQGVPKPRVDVDVPVNDLLNWHSMRRARDSGCAVAELSGANVERLWKYKAKFNPTLAPYYVAERTAPSVRLLLALYKWWDA